MNKERRNMLKKVVVVGAGVGAAALVPKTVNSLVFGKTGKPPKRPFFWWTLESPDGAEDFDVGRFPYGITIKKVTAHVVGSSPSVTIDPKFGSDRSAAGTSILSSATAITNTTTGQVITSFGDATIPAGSTIWLETTAQTGTVTTLCLLIEFEVY